VSARAATKRTRRRRRERPEETERLKTSDGRDLIEVAQLLEGLLDDLVEEAAVYRDDEIPGEGVNMTAGELRDLLECLRTLANTVGVEQSNRERSRSSRSGSRRAA
jgi:hypothetical protein